MLEYLMLINRDVSYIARGDTHAGQAAVGNAISSADDFQTRLGAIELAVETLVRLGVENDKFTEEEFFAMAQKIDAEDGIMNGRRDVARMTKIYPNCGKPNNGTKVRCMWCETDLRDTPARQPAP